MRKVIFPPVVVFALIILAAPILNSRSLEYPLQDTQVYVDPVSISEPVDATFDVTVGIVDVVDLGGFGVIFGWDPTVLEYVSHTATPENVINPIVLTVADAVDAAAGTYELAAATLAGGGFDGSGTIFSLTLRVKAEGFSALEFLQHDLADAAAQAIPHTTVNGTFDNRPPVEQYELVIGVSGSGTTDPVPGTYLYDADTVVPVDAVPENGWILDYWLLDAVDVGSTDPYVVTMDANHTLTAVFVEAPVVQYELVIGVSGGGTTVPAPGAYLYDAGIEVSVDAVPDAGWIFDYWLLDGSDGGSTSPYAVTMDGNHTLTAVFVQQYELVIDVVGSGTTNPAPGSYLTKEGITVSVDALPDVGWALDYWLLDAVDVGSTDPYVVTMDANHTLTAVFVEAPVVQYELVIGVSGGGTTVPAPGAYLYDAGIEVSVDAVPDSGWMLDEWLLDSVSMGAADPYVVTMDANHTLTAVFVEAPVVQATIESSDSAGTEKNTFHISEEVYVTGTGYSPLTEYNLSIVEDADAWADGMTIPPRVPGTETTITSDANGDILVTLVWSDSLTIGEFDIIVDIDGDGYYTEGVDALDSDGVGTTAGFFVIPEFWLGTILGLGGCFAALGVLAVTKRKRPNNLEQLRQ